VAVPASMVRQRRRLGFWGCPAGQRQARCTTVRNGTTRIAVHAALALLPLDVSDRGGVGALIDRVALPPTGAFTGGFSAGYFNTVGSKVCDTPAASLSPCRRVQRAGMLWRSLQGDSLGSVGARTQAGWEPSTFKSSREDRANVAQSVEDFMDDDEKAERQAKTLTNTVLTLTPASAVCPFSLRHRATPHGGSCFVPATDCLPLTRDGDDGGGQSAYDTFGSAATEAARLQAETEAQNDQGSGVLGGAILDCLVVPVTESIGECPQCTGEPQETCTSA